MIRELIEVYRYDPLHIPQLNLLQWFCIGIFVAYFGLILYLILTHGTVPYYKDASQIVYVEQYFHVPRYSPTIGLLDNGSVGYISYHSL